MTRFVRPSSLALAAAAAALLAAGPLPAAGQDVEQRKGFRVRVTEPADHDVVIGKGKLAAKVEIDDPELVDRVEFFVDDAVVFIDREAPYEAVFDFGAASKTYVVRAAAYHRNGASVSAFVITRKIALSYHLDVQRVVLNATVLDGDNHPVLGLARDDFKVLEDGKERQILDFYTEQRPIALAVVIDTSGSMKDQMDETRKAATGFLDFLEEDDRAMVVDFDEQVFLIQDLTGDKELLAEALGSTDALGGTALYDALHASFGRLKRLKGRKAIILLSDGDDTESQFKLKDVIEEARTSDVIVYAIGLGGGFSGVARGVLKDFAQETGGRSFFPGKAEELAGVYKQIADELRSQYHMTYSSINDVFDGRWVKIGVVPTRNKDLKVLTRRGYYAVRGE